MQIRLYDTPEQVEAFAERIRGCFNVVEESTNYPDRGASRKVRRYLDIRIPAGEGEHRDE